MDIELPKLDSEKKEELDKLEMELYQLKNNDIRVMNGEIEGFKQGLSILKQERVLLAEKAGHIPQIYNKQVKNKDKEIKAVEKLMVEKKEEIKKLKYKIRTIERETIPELSASLYVPYLIELNLLFWELQRKSFDERTNDYDPFLLEITTLQNKAGVYQYKTISERDTRRFSRALHPLCK